MDLGHVLAFAFRQRKQVKEKDLYKTQECCMVSVQNKRDCRTLNCSLCFTGLERGMSVFMLWRKHFSFMACFGPGKKIVSCI